MASLAGSLPFSLLALSLLPTAQGIRLNGPLARPHGGDVVLFQLDHEGKHLVYVADQEVDDRRELYVVSSGAGGLARLKLNGALVADGDVSSSVLLSPDGTRVLYIADQDTDGVHELYSVPISGGAPVKLNAPLTVNERVSLVDITSDSAYVVFVAGLVTSPSLWFAPLDGSAPAVRIDEPSDGPVQTFALSPDGSRVLFIAGTITQQLYSVVLDGSRARVGLVPSPRSGLKISSFEIAPDGARVALRTDQIRGGRFDLYASAIDGGGFIELHRGFGRSEGVLDMRISGPAVFFRAAPDPGLYRVPLDGSTPATLISATQERVSEFTLSPDGTRLAYLASLPSTGSSNLFVMPADGSAPAVQVNPPLVALGTVYGGFQFSPDSGRLVYQAIQDTYPQLEIYSAPADASTAPLELNPPLPADSQVFFGFAFAADSAVVFRANADDRAKVELYSAPILGGTAVKLNGPLVFGGNVASEFFSVPAEAFTVSGDGRVVAYLADQEEDSVHELYVGPTRGTFPARKASQSMPIGPLEGDVTDYRFTAGGRQIVYRADEIENDVFELFLVDADRTASPRRLSMPLVNGGDVHAFELSPDGARVAFRADAETDEKIELYSMPLDGSSLPVRLHAPFADDVDVAAGFRFTPDGARVLFSVQLEITPQVELRSAPADGSGPDVRISPVPTPGSVVDASPSTLLVTPDSATVVFRGFFSTPGTSELWSSPVDGSLPPVQLNSPLQPGERVGDLRLSPAGTRVLFHVHSSQSYLADLFSVPVDGSQPAVHLNGAVPISRLYTLGIAEFAPDGASVVFPGMVGNEGPRLYVVPTDGSSAPVAIQPPTPAGSLLGTLTVVGDRALFLCRPGFLRTQLFSVPLDGSAPPVRVSRPVPWTSTVLANSSDLQAPAYRVSPDGRTVVFTCNATGSLEFYAAPVDGSAPSVRLTSGTTPPSSVHSDFLFTPDSRAVLYRRDPGVERMTEVFLVPLAGGAPRLVGGPETVLVRKFLLSPDGRRVVTQAENPLQLGVQELFLSFLPPSGVLPR